MDDRREILETYSYGGMDLPLTAYRPAIERGAPGAHPRAPGAGVSVVEALTVVATGADVAISATVRGDNVAYIFVELFIKDRQATRYYGPVLREYVRATRDQDTGGLSRPVWEEEIRVVETVRAALPLMTGGAGHALCFSSPEAYGSPRHRLRGLYVPAGAGLAELRTEGRRGDRSSAEATLLLDEAGAARGLVPGGGARGRSTSRLRIPKKGDRFTPLVEVLVSSADGSAWTREVSAALSSPLVVGDRPLKMVTGPPLPGKYLGGLVIQDLDGRLSRQYVPFAIQA